MLLFVYGTLLKKGENHEMIAGRAKFIGKGRVRAVLFDLNVGFPSVLLEPGRVYGEVYDIDEDLLDELDEFEGYYPGRSEDNVYCRKSVPVDMSDDTKCEALIYYMEPEMLAKFPAEVMTHGRWIK